MVYDKIRDLYIVTCYPFFRNGSSSYIRLPSLSIVCEFIYTLLLNLFLFTKLLESSFFILSLT